MQHTLQYPVTQHSFRKGALMCTSSCLMYSYFCSRMHSAHCDKEEAFHGTPSVATMTRLFEMSSDLHSDMINRHHMGSNQMLSVNDILDKSVPNAATRDLFHMDEIEGSFNDELVKAFQGEMEEQRESNQEGGRGSAWENASNISVHSFKEGLQKYLREGTSAILTIEEMNHTFAIHRCVDKSCTLFDPARGTIITFDSFEGLVEYIQGFELHCEFTCYFLHGHVDKGREGQTEPSC
jgi:hypothetical protein